MRIKESHIVMVDNDTPNDELKYYAREVTKTYSYHTLHIVQDKDNEDLEHFFLSTFEDDLYDYQIISENKAKELIKNTEIY